MMNCNFKAMLGTAIVLSSLVGVSQAAYITTGVYDENVVNTNAVDTLAASSNRSIVDFTADMAAAFAADLGGVVDFDNVSRDGDDSTSLPVNLDPGAPSFTAIYGVGQSRSLVVTRLNYDPVGPTNGMNQNTLTERISNGSALGLSGTGDYTLGFSTPLKEWGITALSRGSDRRGTMTITHTDSTTYAFNLQVVDGAVGANDTLFSYAAPAGKLIASVSFAGSFLRWDDMGFVAAVPEPATLSLLGLASFGLLVVRRRR